MGLFREYLLILAGGALGSVCGVGFGAVVGAVSPEFINALTQPHPIQAPERAGAAMGMIGGLLVGAAAMAAGRPVGGSSGIPPRAAAGERTERPDGGGVAFAIAGRARLAPGRRRGYAGWSAGNPGLSNSAPGGWSVT